MSSPFLLTDIDSKRNVHHVVSWPQFNDIRDLETKIKLLDVLFNELRLPDTGLVIKFNQDEVDVMWVNELSYLGHPEIDQYMHDHYDIVGVAFTKKQDAQVFLEFLEKKYIWKVLSE